VVKKAIYLALAITLEGKKELLAARGKSHH